MIGWERKALQAAETCIGRCDLCKLVCLYDFASYLIEDIEFGRDRLEGEARRHWGLRRRSDGVDICSACRKNGRWHQSPNGKVTRSGGFTVTCGQASKPKERARSLLGEQFKARMSEDMEREMRRVFQDQVVFGEARVFVPNPKAAERREEERTPLRDSADAFVYAHWGRRSGKTLTQNAIMEHQLRFRAAMQGMANVAQGIHMALHWRGVNFKLYEHGQRYDQDVTLIERERAEASETWSRRVREGVKALRPPGPVVACQGDWEDD